MRVWVNRKNTRLAYQALYVQKFSYTWNLMIFHNICCQTVTQPYPFFVFIFKSCVIMTYACSWIFVSLYLTVSHSYVMSYWQSTMKINEENACGMSLVIEIMNPEPLQWCTTQNQWSMTRYGLLIMKVWYVCKQVCLTSDSLHLVVLCNSK